MSGIQGAQNVGYELPITNIHNPEINKSKTSSPEEIAIRE